MWNAQFYKRFQNFPTLFRSESNKKFNYKLQSVSLIFYFIELGKVRETFGSMKRLFCHFSVTNENYMLHGSKIKNTSHVINVETRFQV